MNKSLEELYDYILKEYGKNCPFFYSEIKYKDYSDIWKSKQLTALLHAQKLRRFEKGIYYVPVEQKDSIIDPQKIIDKKYIGNNEDGYIGYYSGYSLLNNLGLTTQVPFTLEIFTNNETSKAREVFVGNVKILLRKARVPIDSSNVAVLSFLELMNFIEPSYIDEYRMSIIKKFINEHNITRKDITKFAPYFPDKVFRNLVETEIIYFIRKK